LVRATPREIATWQERPPSRWTLAEIQHVCVWLSQYSRSGLWRLLDDLDIRWKRARDHVHSPDPAYLAKVAVIEELRETVRTTPSHHIVVFQDELPYYRQPTLANGYAVRGSKAPLAERSHRSNTATRVAGALNCLTGQVTALQASRVGVRELVRLYEQLCQAYPTAERLSVVQDNWPVHFHPDVLAALEPQRWLEPCVPGARPPNWPTEPSPRARRLHLPIQLVPLPTYASETNPIEKLWRWLKQEVLHLHPWADDLATLRQEALAFLDQFAHGSDALLRYVGLLVPG
jgi:hypothetical protein